MKIKLQKEEDGKWMSGIYRGDGGMSSLIRAVHGRSFIKAVASLFNVRYLWRGFTWK